MVESWHFGQRRNAQILVVNVIYIAYMTQPVSVTLDDFGPQAANATSSREHDSNLASAVSPLLVRQLGTAFRHQFKN